MYFQPGFLTSHFTTWFTCLFSNSFKTYLLPKHTCLNMHAKSLHSCLTLCEPMDCIPPGSSVHGILQARILEWVAMPSSKGYFQHRDRTCISLSPALASGFFTTSATWEAILPIIAQSFSSFLVLFLLCHNS